MKKKVCFSMYFLLVVLMAACHKEYQKNQSEASEPDFIMSQGMLVFKDENSFMEILKGLYSIQDKLDMWERSIPGFVSQRTWFEELAKDKLPEELSDVDKYKYVYAIVKEGDGALSMERNIYNDVLATLISKDGFIQIGDLVYRFTYERYYYTDIGNIEQLFVNKIDVSSPDIKEKEIEREFIFEDINVSDARGITVGECTTTSDDKRVKGLIVREELFGNNCNITTKHQKKVLGVWWANSTSLSVSYSGNFVKMFSNCSPAPQAFFSGYASESNSSSKTLVVPANHSSWGGCNGEVTPFHDGQYSSTHIAGGKTCTLACPPYQPCN